MLNITIHDNAEQLRLQIEGELSGTSVRELARCWRTASSTLEGRKLIVDLRGASGVDPGGRAFLRRLRRKGAEIARPAAPPARGHGSLLRRLLASFALTG